MLIVIAFTFCVNDIYRRAILYGCPFLYFTQTKNVSRSQTEFGNEEYFHFYKALGVTAQCYSQGWRRK
jgi:hypothetical protein